MPFSSNIMHGDPPAVQRKARCPDCYYCQQCSENRCRLCRDTGKKGTCSDLGTGFTYGQYMAWKKKKGNVQGSRD